MEIRWRTGEIAIDDSEVRKQLDRLTKEILANGPPRRFDPRTGSFSPRLRSFVDDRCILHIGWATPYADYPFPHHDCPGTDSAEDGAQ